MAKKTAKSAKVANRPAGPKGAKKYVSPKTSLENLESEFSRADLIFDGVDHSGASFEARVFLNNELADEQTPMTPEHGYAGSFHIFGHGGCFGDDLTHCQIRGLPRPYDPRPAHPLTPARKVLMATDAIRQALAHGREMTVTVVPVVMAGTPKCDYENVLKFDRFSVVTYL
jgi:hypothetical protein